MAKPTSKRRKLEPGSTSSDEEDAQIAADRLKAYGEKFMSMFEDYQPGKEEKLKKKRKSAPVDTTDSDDLSDDDDDDDDSSQSDGGEDSAGQYSSDSDGSGDEHDALLDSIFNSKALDPKSKARKPAAAVPPPHPPKKRSAPSPSNKQQQQQQDPAATSLQLKLERKRFMSHKASRITTGSEVGSKGGSVSRVKREEDEGITHAQFLEMQREVQMYGASALDKKSKKKFDAEMLALLGSKPQKGPKISAAIGLGMAKKQAQREAKAAAEMLAAGMGTPKSNKKEKKGGFDKGLMEDGGAFRHGVMKVRKGEAPKGRPLKSNYKGKRR